MNPELSEIAARIDAVVERIRRAELRFARALGSTSLLAVSKTRPAQDVRAAFAFGQRRFGENLLQEGQKKIEALADCNLEWHFIGPIQSNKTRPVATLFDWVHSVDRMKVALRLSQQRPANAAPLNVCLQVNVSDEATKSGVLLEDLGPLAKQAQALPRLRLRGLMAIPAPSNSFEEQREAFARLRQAFEALNADGLELDTLSMGMSNDLEAAIAEGATIVRVGTAIFGERVRRIT